jgi:hypothetical protein
MVIDDDTKIIPGHGKLSNKAEYKNYLGILETLKTNMLKAISEGKTEDEAANDNSITKVFDDLGYGSGFVNSERIKRTLYKSLKK